MRRVWKGPIRCTFVFIAFHCIEALTAVDFQACTDKSTKYTVIQLHDAEITNHGTEAAEPCQEKSPDVYSPALLTVACNALRLGHL